MENVWYAGYLFLFPKKMARVMEQEKIDFLLINFLQWMEGGFWYIYKYIYIYIIVIYYYYFFYISVALDTVIKIYVRSISPGILCIILCVILMTSYILKLANLMAILPINSTLFLLVLHGMGRWFRDYRGRDANGRVIAGKT